MKQETNNEMDLLLRRLGRRQAESVSNDNGQPDHLDADELNAYAENAVPAVARARYTEHLAECGRCRDLVVSLSGAAGVAVAREAVSVAEPAGFKKFLASLFSPMVLRYAAPALGLILIAVIGVIVLRRPEEANTDFVVQVPREQPLQAPASSPATPPQATFSVEQNGLEKNSKQEAQSKRDEDPAPVVNAPPSVNSVSAEVRQTADATQPVAKESPAAPKPADVISESKRKDEAEEQKADTAGRVAKVANEPPPPSEKAAEPSPVNSRTVAELTPLRAQKRGVVAAAPSAAGSAANVQRDGEDDKNNYVETRSVAGRRFRKEGGAWIDTAYESPRSITNIARDSEQFRALVADEPAIKQIADQLNGEILVVWKGRAYRIR